MEMNYIPGVMPEGSSILDGRDDRTKFAYHLGTSLARTVLDRLLPVLQADDAEWLYDQMFDLHMTLYSATLFELHLTAADDTFTDDDRYSNGWPVVWRERRGGDADQSQKLYDNIGEDVPDNTFRMISPPERAYESPEDAAVMLAGVEMDDTSAAVWKTVSDMYLKGLVTVMRDDDGRICKTAVGAVLRPTWVLTPDGDEYGAQLEADGVEL